MKNIILVLSLAFFTLNLNAQNLSPVKFGLVTGLTLNHLTFSSIEGLESPSSNYGPGFNAGLIIRFPMQKRWNFNTELLYTTYSAEYTFKYKTDILGERITSEVINNTELAYFVLNADFSFIAHEKFHLNFGPSIQYFLSGEDNINVSTNSSVLESYSEVLPIDDNKDLDLGLNLGCSYLISEKTILNLKIFSGLMPLRDSESDLTKNSIHFSILYFF
jgi:hypothetical protein